jgi:hypothetical protein
MTINTYVCGSCAVASIANVGEHHNPKEVLKIFCGQTLGVKSSFKPSYSKLQCFYIFCAGPEVKSSEPGGSHHSKNHWPRYGTEFAQYLIEHKLGEIVTVGPKVNLRHHPSTTAQLWAWSPDQKALETWWEAEQDQKCPMEEPSMEDPEDDYEDEDQEDD